MIRFTTSNTNRIAVQNLLKIHHYKIRFRYNFSREEVLVNQWKVNLSKPIHQIKPRTCIALYYTCSHVPSKPQRSRNLQFTQNYLHACRMRFMRHLRFRLLRCSRLSASCLPPAGHQMLQSSESTLGLLELARLPRLQAVSYR